MDNMSDYFELVDLDSPSTTNAEFLFSGLLPKTGLVVLNGQSSTGKSFFILWLAACLAGGMKLGHFKSGSHTSLKA